MSGKSLLARHSVFVYHSDARAGCARSMSIVAWPAVDPQGFVGPVVDPQGFAGPFVDPQG